MRATKQTPNKTPNSHESVLACVNRVAIRFDHKTDCQTGGNGALGVKLQSASEQARSYLEDQTKKEARPQNLTSSRYIKVRNSSRQNINNV